MKKIIMLTLWVGLSAQLCIAQTVSGTITNPAKQPITDANITVLNSTRGTISKQDGTFSLQLIAGKHTLQISEIGYATKVLEIMVIDNELTIDVILEPATTQIDEVVVTALKREQRLQDIPIAVTSLNPTRLQETRSWDVDELTGIIPNYSATQLGVGFQGLQSIRGIQVFSENPAIATYIDGVNSLDIAAGGIQFMDVERVEVLRGPQGTLYGRNALGGVINIITKKPTNKQSGFFESSLGNLGLQRHGLGFKTPLIDDTLFFGIAAQYQYRDGFLTNSTEGTADPVIGQDGRRVGDESSIYGNVFLKWLPNDRWDATLNLKTQIDQSDASTFFVSVQDEQVALDNPDSIFLGRVGEHQRNLFNASAAVNYRANAFKLSSISAYQRVGLRFNDLDFLPQFPGQVFASYNDGQVGVMNNPQEVFSQEFRISSEDKNDTLNYTAGTFYFNQTNYEPSTNTARIVDETTLDIFSQIGKNEGIALFGEVNYAFAKAFTATAGLRYEYENRKLIFSRFESVDGIVNFIDNRTELSGNYDALLPKFALGYQISNNQNAYASYTRGFRAGGINGNLLPEGVSQTFDPEYSNNFEIGYKSNWFNNKLQANLAAFHIDWKDLQFFNSFGNFVFARTNVGDARSTGIELETIAIPLKGLQLEANLGINDTEYKDFVLSRDILNETTGMADTITDDVSGNTLSNAPEHTFFFAGQYQFPAFKDYALTIRGEFRNIGDAFSDIQNDLEIESYSLLNTLVTLSNGKYTLSAWVRNIADERYIAFGAPDTSFGRSTRIAEPRTFGTTLNIKF
ncbi:TonB-dependent receptor [Ulvibacterium sp.]|uniref:TonB-dependent receptor n=1 Tax=Ulvibacterium sp. TaxID=2665914 RepID=UPI00261CE380|nr:TonB-dependent receptor [Ulvibacterium sp.]